MTHDPILLQVLTALGFNGITPEAKFLLSPLMPIQLWYRDDVFHVGLTLNKAAIDRGYRGFEQYATIRNRQWLLANLDSVIADARRIQHDLATGHPSLF